MLRALIGTTMIAGAVIAIGASHAPGMTLASSPNTTTSSLAVMQSAPALGATVTFHSTYSNNAKNPTVVTNCYQSGTVVWGEVDSASSATSPGVLLGGNSSPWLTNGGSATCTADLYSLTFKGGVEQWTLLAGDPFTAAAG
jgi:hypothetical protein